MAEALFAAALPSVCVMSAGTGALVGEPADPTAQELMAARGMDISAHRAQQIKSVLCQQAEIILVMDSPMRRHLEDQYPFVTGKVFRLCEFSKTDVPDPYRRPREIFEQSLALIDTGVDAWAERINRI
jgi:protein-tyrosine phosphatase